MCVYTPTLAGTAGRVNNLRIRVRRTNSALLMNRVCARRLPMRSSLRLLFFKVVIVVVRC